MPSRHLTLPTDKEEADKLAEAVEAASRLLDEYNDRLTKELVDRKRLSKALPAFIASQKDKLAESQMKYQVPQAISLPSHPEISVFSDHSTL